MGVKARKPKLPPGPPVVRIDVPTDEHRSLAIRKLAKALQCNAVALSDNAKAALVLANAIEHGGTTINLTAGTISSGTGTCLEIGRKPSGGCCQ